MLKFRKSVFAIIPILCLSVSALAEDTIEEPVEEVIFTNSAYVLDGEDIYDNRDIANNIYESESLPGASAIYAKNGATARFRHPEIIGNGYLTDEDLSAELASKYGYASAVLVYGADTKISLWKPTITTSEDSHANGGFATYGGNLSIIGGTITTNNPLGHGLDATYGGNIHVSGTRIHTSGQHSGALATDFGGGYITAHNIKATTELPGSPGIYCAGNSVIKAYRSTFVSNSCEAVMAAHDNGYTYLYDCDVTGTIGLNGHNSMSEDYSYIFMQGGRLNSTSDALISEMGGKTVMTLDRVRIGQIGNGNLIEPQSGRLIVNLSKMKAIGDVVRAAKSYLEVSLKKTKLKASVSATKFTMDSRSKWDVTGESSIVDISIANRRSVRARENVTVYFNTLNIGGEDITEDYTIGNVNFVYSEDLVDDYEEQGPPGPPPGG
jgi:hypothetical protein